MKSYNISYETLAELENVDLALYKSKHDLISDLADVCEINKIDLSYDDMEEYILTRYRPELGKSNKVLEKIRNEIKSQNNIKPSQFSLKDKISYYQKRMSDKKISESQRNYAKNRLNYLKSSR